MAKQM